MHKMKNARRQGHSAARDGGDGWRGGSQVDTKATECVYAGGKDAEGVEDGSDSAQEETGRGKGMCMTQESTGASYYSAKY